jgi:hypothetical protein
MKDVRVQILFDQRLADEIHQWRRKHLHPPTMSEAIRQLIVMGLNTRRTKIPAPEELADSEIVSDG